MPDDDIVKPPAADDAAVMAMALSLHTAWESNKVDTSELYQGHDEFLRCCMRAARIFENWACVHVDFAALTDCWPYLLQDKAGDVLFKQLLPEGLTEFNDLDCYDLAAGLGLTVFVTSKDPWPVDLHIQIDDMELRVLSQYLDLSEGSDCDTLPVTTQAEDLPTPQQYQLAVYGKRGAGNLRWLFSVPSLDDLYHALRVVCPAALSQVQRVTTTLKSA